MLRIVVNDRATFQVNPSKLRQGLVDAMSWVEPDLPQVTTGNQGSLILAEIIYEWCYIAI